MLETVDTSEIMLILVVTLGMVAIFGAIIWFALAVYRGKIDFGNR